MAARSPPRAARPGCATTLTIAAAFGCPFDRRGAGDRVARSSPPRLPGAARTRSRSPTRSASACPRQVADLVAGGRAAAPDAALRAHFHNTRNTGYANAFAAREAGVAVLDASGGGIGGCPFAPAATGNIATEDLAYLLNRPASDRRGRGGARRGRRWIGRQLDVTVPGQLGGATPSCRPPGRRRPLVPEPLRR